MNGASDFRFRHRQKNRSPLSGALVSLLIILIGVGMLLDNLGILRGRDIWDWAPALLIAFGVIRMIECGGRPGGLVFGGLMAGGGAIWLLDNLGFIRFNPAMFAPLLLIGFGVSLLVKNLDRHAHFNSQAKAGSAPDPATSGESTIWQWAFFGGTRRAIGTDDFRGGEALSIFGGINLDLRQSKIKTGQAVLDCTAVFGGIDLKVPEDWVVILKGNAVFGGFDEKTAHPSTGPELVVSGMALFGGVSVRN